MYRFKSATVKFINLYKAPICKALSVITFIPAMDKKMQAMLKSNIKKLFLSSYSELCSTIRRLVIITLSEPEKFIYKLPLAIIFPAITNKKYMIKTSIAYLI